MSGGSLDYLYCKEPGEIVSLLNGYMDRILHELDRARALGPGTIFVGHEKKDDGKDDYSKQIRRDPTDIERAAVELFRVEIVKLNNDARALFDRVRSMCDVLHSIEWSASCDTGPDDTLQTCEKWLSKRAGVESIRALLEATVKP